MLTLYTYKKCSTCQKAVRFLKSHHIDFIEHPIRETPPTKEHLNAMLAYYDGDIKKLFNTSGQDYRALDMKSKLPTLSHSEAIDMLSKNGNLIKRPFALTESSGLVGFKEDQWLLFCKATL